MARGWRYTKPSLASVRLRVARILLILSILIILLISYINTYACVLSISPYIRFYFMCSPRVSASYLF